MGRKKIPPVAPSAPALPDPPRNKERQALARVAERMKIWRPARQVLRRVRAVPTIFPWLDLVSKVNGWPIERFGVVHGPSSEGKTKLALGVGLSFLQRGHFFGLVDAEYTTPISWLEGLMAKEADNPLFLSLRPKSYEQTVDAVREMLRAIIAAKKTGEIPEETSALIAVDSMRKLVPENFLEKIRKFGAQGKKGSVDGMNGMGAAIKAKMNADWFDELTPMLYEAGAALLAIGRESENRDGARTGQDWKLTGGKSLVFESSFLVRVERDWIREGPVDNQVVVGEKHDCALYKSKVAGKDEDVDYFCFHTSNGKLTPAGFDTGRDLLELGVQLGAVKLSGSWYSFGGKRWQGRSQAVKRLAADVGLRDDLEMAVRARFARSGAEPAREART
jgi:recombination protein RecA